MSNTPSYTVENYLKAIYQAQSRLAGQDAYVPMGQLASALNVVPGTATTMMKALAESGLVAYEPYVGVRLTPAGEKLAAMVLRRHRLIEQFLVQVMGMSWAEVHEEAEHLEHAVSDRLIERIDEMLGHPDVDPHGDPIPNPEGQMASGEYESLLTCPLHTPVRVTRISDQDAEFLRFLESSRLKPGEVVEIEERDAAADRVRLRRRDDRITIGTRAAGKLMVQLALLLLVLAAPVVAQSLPAASMAAPFEIQDNSFLVEEAFNQEPGIFQNIVGFVREEDDWELALTQEWPFGSQAHQVSYTLPLSGGSEAGGGIGDVLLHYRYQLLAESASRPAFAPRVSLILPTGGRERGHETLGYQINLPFSKQVEDLYLHWNTGLTVYPGVNVDGEPREANLLTPHVSGSVIWRARAMIHPMLEVMFESEEGVSGRHSRVTLSPGLRAGRNMGNRQLVVGAALPVTVHEGESSGAVLVYFSYELPYRR